MGIYDRDYMREDHAPSPAARRSAQRHVTTYVILAIGVILAIILISRLWPGIGAAAPPSGPPGIVYPLDLNTATIDELLTIPGIGPATAEHIVKNRPFRSVDDLLTIYGIGETRLRTFSRYITVTPPPPPPTGTTPSGD